MGLFLGAIVMVAGGLIVWGGLSGRIASMIAATVAPHALEPTGNAPGAPGAPGSPGSPGGPPMPGGQPAPGSLSTGGKIIHALAPQGVGPFKYPSNRDTGAASWAKKWLPQPPGSGGESNVFGGGNVHF